MKITRLLIIFMILYFTKTMGQNAQLVKPDYGIIEKEINDTSSRYGYSKLMERFQKGDSTFTIEEKRHLYYGFIFQNNYSPYKRSEYADSIRIIRQKQDLNEEDYRKLLNYSNKILEDDPFNTSVISNKLTAYKKLKNEKDFRTTLSQFMTVIDAILSSGNGATKEMAFYVIAVPHEYAVLNVLGFKYAGKQSLVEHYDYLEVEENEYKINGLYFDITPSLNSLNSKKAD